MQAAIATQSIVQQVAKAVLDVCGGEYLPAHDLHLKPDVAKLAKSSAKLAVLLADAYKATPPLLGRIYYPVGRSKYAYGPVGKKAGGSRKVIKGVHGHFRATVTMYDAGEVLSLIEKVPDVTWQKGTDETERVNYLVTKVGEAKAVLEFLIQADCLKHNVQVK